MRNTASTPSRPPAATRRDVAVTAASVTIAAVLALADAAMTLEHLLGLVPPEIIDGLARGLLVSSFAP